MPAPFQHRLRVRYSECDMQGVVFNANFLAYMDDAINEMWRAAVPGGYKGMVSRGVDHVVAEATVRYLGPARFEDELQIAAAVTRLGTTGLSTEMRVTRGDELLAVGNLRHVFVTAAAGDKTPIPEDVRRGLEAFSADV